MIAATITFAPMTPNMTGMMCHDNPYKIGYKTNVHTPPIQMLQSYNGIFNAAKRCIRGLSNSASNLRRNASKIMPSRMET